MTRASPFALTHLEDIHNHGECPQTGTTRAGGEIEVAMKSQAIARSRSVLLSTASILLWTVSASAASYTTGGGDASFRRINASGGKLIGVDVSGSVVTANGVQISLARLAQQAAAAGSGSGSSTTTNNNLGQPNGAAQLDNNGTLTSNSVTYQGNAVSLATLAALAETALAPSKLGAANGIATLDGAEL